MLGVGGLGFSFLARNFTDTRTRFSLFRFFSLSTSRAFGVTNFLFLCRDLQAEDWIPAELVEDEQLAEQITAAANDSRAGRDAMMRDPTQQSNQGQTQDSAAVAMADLTLNSDLSGMMTSMRQEPEDQWTVFDPDDEGQPVAPEDDDDTGHPPKQTEEDETSKVSEIELTRAAVNESTDSMLVSWFLFPFVFCGRSSHDYPVLSSFIIWISALCTLISLAPFCFCTVYWTPGVPANIFLPKYALFVSIILQ